MSNELPDSLSELMKNMPVEMNIFEDGIDYTLLGDFYTTLKNIAKNKEKNDPETVLSLNWNELPDDDARKKAIAFCSMIGTVDAFRKLEAFKNESSNTIRQWTQLALLHCRLNLENELLDQPIGYIASGLGGKGNKLRYYFAVILKEPFTEAMVNFAIESYREICAQNDAELEEAILSDNYLLIRILGPFGKAIGNIVETGIEQNDFLLPYYYVTNMRKPTDEDIKNWIANNLSPNEEANIHIFQTAEDDDDDGEEDYYDDEDDDDEDYNIYKNQNEYNDN